MAREEYEKWEKGQEISPVSPEAYYAEAAWNAALDAALEIMGGNRAVRETLESLHAGK